MGLFRHPHLVRGVVHTPEGAFQIERGVADLPDEVGAALGWTRLDEETQPAAPQPVPNLRDHTGDHVGAV